MSHDGASITKLLINAKSKMYEQLSDICSLAYVTKPCNTFGEELDILVQCKPKQVICVINGADLLFEWKRKHQLQRIENVVSVWKHCYVVIVIKNELELRKAMDCLNAFDLNIECVYVDDLNQCVRILQFIDVKTQKITKQENEGDTIRIDLEPSDEEYEQTVIDSIASIHELNENDALHLFDVFSSIKSLANATHQQLEENTTLSQQKISSVLDLFNNNGHESEE